MNNGKNKNSIYNKNINEKQTDLKWKNQENRF